MAVVWFNPKAGKIVPAVPGKLPPAGFGRYEELVDTRSGDRHPISCEPSVNSGQGVIVALAQVREDNGHEGQPVWLRAEQWDRMSQGERDKYLAPRTSRPQSAPESEAARLAAEVAALKAQLAAQQQPGGKGGR